MKFEINSSEITFSGKGFKAFFGRINEACQTTKISYYVVGAFARDLIIENIFKNTTGIATRDIDIAIRVDSWKNFTKFIAYLKANHGFKNGNTPHEFISPEGIYTDIIPYGNVEKNRKVSFPPDFQREINMLGFQEIHESTIEIVLDNEVSFRVASIESITILKLIAWEDRQPASISEKHTRDIGLIINSYYHAKVSEFAMEFSDLIDIEDFNATLCGARALGRRMKQIVGASTLLEKEIQELFEYILKEEDNSLFVTQLSNSSNFDYPFSLSIIQSLEKGFNELHT